MLRSVFSTGAGTFVSRVLGLVRDVVIASVFGAGASADAFFVAFRIPNFFRRLFGEGAFSQAFVPVLSEYRAARGEAEVRDLASHVAGTLGVVLLAVTVVGILAAPALVYVFAPGFAATPGQAELTGSLLRLTFPYLLFISLTAFAGGILNTWGRFGVPAVTPSLLNVALIGAAIGLAPRLDEPATALAWGVFVGGVAQLAFQLPFLGRIRMLVRPRLRRAHAGVRRLLRLIVPALLGVSVAQVNLLVDTIIASFLVTGSVSWLYYSDRLMEFPLGVFGIALATVALPSLATRHAAGDARRFRATLDWALRLVVVIATPRHPRARDPRRADALHRIPARRFRGARGADVGVQPRRLRLRPGGVHRGEGARRRLPCPSGDAHPGAHRGDRDGRERSAQPPARGTTRSCRACACDLARRMAERDLLLRSLWVGGIYRPERGWPRLLVQVAVAVAVTTLVLTWLRGSAADWMIRTAPDRALVLGGLIVAGAAAWFGTLAVSGVRPRDFLRPGAIPSSAVVP